MASLRQTRRFSFSPTPPSRQPLNSEAYQRDSPIPMDLSSTSHLGESLKSRSEDRSRTVRKVKSQLAVKTLHSDGDGHENEDYHASTPPFNHNATREHLSGSIEPKNRKKRTGKGRSKSARPRDTNGMEEGVSYSLQASGNPRQQLPALSAQSTHFLVPKSKSRARSRSPSLIPSHTAIPRMEEDPLSNDLYNHEHVDINLKLRSKNKTSGTPRSRSRSSSADVVTPKSYHSSRLPAPTSRSASPLPPQTFDAPDPDLAYRPEISGRSPSPAVRTPSSSARSSSAHKETSRTRSDDMHSRLLSTATSQSRTPQAMPAPIPSNQPPAVSAPRTLKDVMRSLEKDRGRRPRHSPAFPEAAAISDETLSGQSSPSSTPMPSRRRNTHGELDMATLSLAIDVKPNTLLERSNQIQARTRHGLAITNENGHTLGEPQTKQLLPVRRGTAPEISSGLYSIPPTPRNVSSPSGGILKSRQEVVASHLSLILKDEKIDLGRKSQSIAPSRSKTPSSLSHGAHTTEDRHQGPSRHDNSSVSRRLESTTSAKSSMPPSSFPKPVLKSVPVTRKPSTPVRSAFPTLPSPRNPRTETPFSHKLSGSDTSSHSLSHPRRLVIRNPDPNDRLSPASSSNPGFPMSRTAATSGEFTILALSGSQASLGGRVNDINYIVPDDVAAEVANNEERRRKALAGLVQDLRLTSDSQVKEQRTKELLKTSRSRDTRSTVRHRETHRDLEDDEEDDDAFFSKLSTHNDEDSLLEEPEPQADSYFREDGEDGFEEFSDYDDEPDTDEEGEDEEEPPLPPTPKFVHPLKEGDDLESRITRVASLHRISTTPLGYSREPDQDHQLRYRSENPTTWKASPPASSEEVPLRNRTTGTHFVPERSRPSGSDTRLTIEKQHKEARPENIAWREDMAKEEDTLSITQSQGSILGTDNELSFVGSERLSNVDSGRAETLSSGAEALFKQLQVEAEARDAADVDRDKSATSDSHSDSQGNISETVHDVRSSSRGPDNRAEDPRTPLDHQHEPTSLRTWRSTLPFGAYDSLAERHGPSEMRRQEIIWELCETEQAFVKSLRLILRLFVQPLRHEDRSWIPGVPRDVSRLFDWFDDIVHLHSQISSALHAARSSQYPVVIQIAETLRPFVPRLELHQPYLVRLESVSSAIEAMGKDMHNDFGEFVRIQTASPECELMNLPSFLLKPVQRLMKYTLFFKQLWELTPRSHPDHLPTFSLLHSTDMIIRVMQEVKAREEEYELVKNLASRIKGLPSGYQLARRERRLIAQGLLRRVILSDKELIALDAVADTQENHGLRGASLSKITSTSSETSSFTGDYAYHPTRTGKMTTSETDHSLHAESVVSDVTLDSFTNVSRSNSRSTSRSRSSSLRGSLRQKSKESTVYAFVFTDLMILTTPISERMHLLRSPKNVHESKETWKLIDDVGVSRVLGVTDQSGHLSNHGHLVAVELMSMTPNLLDSSTFSDGTTAIPVYLSVPDQKSSLMEGSFDALDEAKAKWLDAFERCFRFTLRSLSFPSYSGTYTNSGGTDLELDTKSSVMSILSSGLPLPMSPSQQLGETQRGRPTDLVQEEREERGWWSLRFQQVLKEVQRSSRSPVFDAGPSHKSDIRNKRQGGKRSEHRPLILSPNPSITVAPSRKGGLLLSLGRKKSK